MARRAARPPPRARRRQRFHHRVGHRRNGHARLLVSLRIDDGAAVTHATEEVTDGLTEVPADYDIREVERFLYREARFADESDYDSWEALCTDDALYWVPAGKDDGDDPL